MEIQILLELVGRTNLMNLIEFNVKKRPFYTPYFYWLSALTVAARRELQTFATTWPLRCINKLLPGEFAATLTISL